VVVSGRRFGQLTANPFDDFVLCLVAEGVTGRARQLALAACVGSFLASDDVDVLWRLRDAVRAADARLANSAEGHLASTLTGLFVAGDGTAYGVSVGDSPLFVAPGPAPRVKVLGREPGTAIGAGETLRAERVIAQWWPDRDGDGTRTRLEPGTSLVLAGRDAQTINC
jgi:hypothetical protein